MTLKHKTIKRKNKKPFYSGLIKERSQMASSSVREGVWKGCRAKDDVVFYMISGGNFKQFAFKMLVLL